MFLGSPLDLVQSHLERVALLTKLLNRGDGLLHALVEASQNLFFAAAEGHLL